MGGRASDDGSLFIVHDRAAVTNLPGGIVVSVRDAGRSREICPSATTSGSAPSRARCSNRGSDEEPRRPGGTTLTRPELKDWIDSLITQGGQRRRQQPPRPRPTTRASAQPRGRVPADRRPDRDRARHPERPHPLIQAACTRPRQRLRPRPARALRTPSKMRSSNAPRSCAPVLSMPTPAATATYRSSRCTSRTTSRAPASASTKRSTSYSTSASPALNRPADAHDILGTYRVVPHPAEMRRLAPTPDEYLELLRTPPRRHPQPGAPEATWAVQGRPKRSRRSPLGPSHSLVNGTLRQGFDPRPTHPPPSHGRSSKCSSSSWKCTHSTTETEKRVARIMMNAELVAAGEHRIIIPGVYRNNYMMALRGMSTNANRDGLDRLARLRATLHRR